MIGQYLSNTNENATVSILQKFLQLNKALIPSLSFSSLQRPAHSVDGCLLIHLCTSAAVNVELGRWSCRWPSSPPNSECGRRWNAQGCALFSNRQQPRWTARCFTSTVAPSGRDNSPLPCLIVLSCLETGRVLRTWFYMALCFNNSGF